MLKTTHIRLHMATVSSRKATTLPPRLWARLHYRARPLAPPRTAQLVSLAAPTLVGGVDTLIHLTPQNAYSFQIAFGMKSWFSVVLDGTILWRREQS